MSFPVTSGPITADAATNKVVGVKKSFTVTASAANKVTGLSKAEKKVVKVTKKGKKFTIKGLKAGKATFKIGKKSYIVKVGATAVKASKASISLTKGKAATVTFKTTAGNGDTLTFTASNKKIALNKKSAKVAKNAAAVKVTAKTAGTAKITATSKITGKKVTVKVTVKNATPVTTATPVVTETPVVTGGATTTPDVTATPVATGGATTAPDVTATPIATGGATTTPVTTPAVTATPTATPEVVTASAVSASAVNAKTIAVTFNKELTKDEQNAVKVSVTREKATQAVKAAFKDAKTLYITRDTDLEFVAGTYTVELSGLTAYKTDVAVEAPVATSLKITSTVLENGLDKAAIKVSVKDQYGEEMAVTENDFATATYNGTDMKAKYNAQTKAFEIDTKTGNLFKVDDSVNVVLLYKTGLTATATLKVVQQTYVQNIALGDYVLPVGTTRLTEDVKNVLVPYTATNNYDEVVTLASGEYSLISTNTAVLDAAKVSLDKDTNGKTYFKIASFESAGKTSIIVMNNKNGQTAKVDLTVQEKAGKPYAIQLDTSSVEVAQGSTAYVGLTITDKYGDKVAAENLVGENALVYGTSNENILSKDKVSVVSDKNDKNYGKLKIDATAAGANKTAVITITLPNGTNTTLQVKVGAKAEPRTIVATADKTTMVAGATAKLTAAVKDQYSSDVADLGKYSVVATVDKADADVVSVNNGTGKEFTVTAQKAGTAKVKVDLQDKDKKVIDTKTVTFTVEANTATNLTYSVDAIPTLFKNEKTTVLASVKTSYAKEVTVTAKKADGTTVAIPANKILSVTSDNKVVVTEKDTDKWYVYGKNTADGIKEDQTAKLTIVVATDDGSVIVNQNVTVSKEDAKTVAIKLYDQAKSDKAKEISSVSVNTYGEEVAFNTDGKAYLYTVDQFGKETPLEKADAVSLSSFNKITGAAKDTATYASNTLTTTATGKAEAGASYKVTLVKDGVTASFTVNVKNATTPVAAAAPKLDGNVTFDTDKKIVTITFDKEIKDATSNALKAKVTFAADGSAFKALGESDTVAIDGKTLKVTFNTALTGTTNKIKIAAGAVKGTENNASVNADITTDSLDASK